MRTFSEKFGNWIFLSLILLLPLAMNPWGVEMYEIPKNTVFKLAVGCLSGLWAWRVMKSKQVIFFVSKPAWLFLLLLSGTVCLSFLTSLRPEVSFWGSYSKQGGILNWLYYLVFFVLAVELLVQKPSRLFFLKALVWSGSLVSIYALFQKMGIDFLPSSTLDSFEGRSFSSLGNPSALASFLLFSLGAEFILWRENADRERGWGISKYQLGRLTLMLLALLASRGRASILGLTIAGVFFAVKRWRKQPVQLAATIGLVLASFWIFVGAQGVDLRSLQSRFALWNSSAHIILDHPLTGVGVENFDFFFPTYATSDFYAHEDYYVTADRPHNEFLEWWISFGLVGALLYGLLAGAVLKKAWCSNGLEEGVALTLLAFFVSNFFGFSLVTHWTLALSFLALLYGGRAYALTLSEHTKKIAFLISVAVLLGSIFTLRIFVGDLLYKRADDLAAAGESTKALELLGQAQRWNSYFSSPYLLSFKIQFAAALEEHNAPALASATSSALAAYRIDHGTLKSLTLFFQLYMAEGETEKAEQVLLQLKSYAPVQPLLSQVIGEFYYGQKRYSEALIHYEQLLELLPHWQAPVFGYGIVSEESRIFWKNHPDFLTVLQHMAEAYLQTGQAEKGQFLLMSIYTSRQVR